MNAGLESLILLQVEDLTLRRLRQELADAPLRVARAETALRTSESALAAATASLAKEATLRRSEELEIADRRSKIVRLAKQMESASSATQITALEHEIAFANAAIGKLEDEELNSMERSETLEAAQSAAKTAIVERTELLEAERAAGAELKAHHTAAIVASEAERTALRAGLTATDEALLSVYDRVAKAKGTAVSEAVDHKCSACQMMVRPQRWNDLTGRDHLEDIFTCETCGRMLYSDPRRDAPVRWEAGEKKQRAESRA